MQAPFAESIRGVQVRIEIPEPDEPGRLVARRTVGSGAPNLDGLEDTFTLGPASAGEFIDWLAAWLAGDHTYRWFRLAREVDLAARVRLNPRKRVSLRL
jgi:hypothetical protein